MNGENTQVRNKQFLVEYDNLWTPINLEFANEQRETDEIIILSPGLGSPELGGLRSELASLGRTAVSFEQPRRNLFDFRAQDIGGQRTGILRGVIAKSMENSGAEKAVLIGHSTSGIDAATVSNQIGENFSSVEYMASSGLTGENFQQAATRVSRFAGPAALANCPDVLSHQVQINSRAARNPWQFSLEAIYAFSRDIRANLDEQNKDGLDIGILQFERDIVFPPNIVTPRIGSLAVRKTLTGETAHACHGSPLDDPESTAKILDKILSTRED